MNESVLRRTLSALRRRWDCRIDVNTYLASIFAFLRGRAHHLRNNLLRCVLRVKHGLTPVVGDEWNLHVLEQGRSVLTELQPAPASDGGQGPGEIVARMGQTHRLNVCLVVHGKVQVEEGDVVGETALGVVERVENELGHSSLLGEAGQTNQRWASVELQLWPFLP